MSQMTPEAFETAMAQLRQQVGRLHDTWNQYAVLYGHSEERIRLLNACAGWFFLITQRALLRETVLGISRLTDSPKKNLTIDLLLDDPLLKELPQVRVDIDNAVQQVKEKAKVIRAHRNKVIAHTDLATAIEVAVPLPTVYKEEISEIIEALVRACNVHDRGVHDSETFFDVLWEGDATELVHILQESAKWAQVRVASPTTE